LNYSLPQFCLRHTGFKLHKSAIFTSIYHLLYMSFSLKDMPFPPTNFPVPHLNVT
jgi:hypothetical protein